MRFLKILFAFIAIFFWWVFIKPSVTLAASCLSPSDVRGLGGNISVSTILCGGTYPNMVITNNNVTLECQGSCTVSGGSGIGIKASGVSGITISGMAIQNQSVGSTSDWLNPSEPCGFYLGAGVSLQGVSNSTVKNVTASGGVVGIEVCGGGNNLIKGNDTSNTTGWGIRLNQSDGNRVAYNSSSNNIRSNGQFSGLESANVLLIRSSNNTVCKNTLANGGDGVYLNGYDYSPANSNNYIYNNDVSGSAANCLEGTGGKNYFLNNNLSGCTSHLGWLTCTQGTVYCGQANGDRRLVVPEDPDKCPGQLAKTYDSNSCPVAPPDCGEPPPTAPPPPPPISPPPPPGACQPPTNLGLYNTVTPHPPPQTDPNSNPDLNIGLRGKQPVSGYLGLVDVAYPQNSPPDIDAPQLCTLFGTKRIPKFDALYAIGKYGGIGQGPEADPPHIAEMATDPNEPIFAPVSGYYIDVTKGLTAMVVYVDDNSIGLEYTLDDGEIKGYAVHIFGIQVDSVLKSLYDSAQSCGRSFLPAVKPGQLLGRAKGDSIQVVIRDSGSFMDPRSHLDWWSHCDAKGPFPKVSHTERPSATVNQTLTFPPLNSLEACPSEIPVNAEMNQQTSPAPGGTSAYYCNITPKDEPAACKKLLNPDPNAPIPDLIDRNTRWSCYPTSCQTWAKNHGGKGIPGCGRYNDVFCADTAPGIPNDLTWLGRLRAYKDFGAKHGLGQCQPDWFPEQDRNTIAVCLGSHIAADPNFLKGSAPATPVSAQVLPACVPTTQAGQCCSPPATPDSPTTCHIEGTGLSSSFPNQCGVAATCNIGTNTCQKLCVSECSEPVQFTEYLHLTQESNDCWRSGTCWANVQVKDGTLYIPYAGMLGNYFAGILDAEHLIQDQFNQNQKVIANGPKDPLFEKVWQDAGVARKLLPQDLQDKLRCDFIKYVQDRKTNNLNSKYISRDAKGNIDGEFKAFGVDVTTIPCRGDATDKTQYDSEWARYWDGIPLFPNDDSQGKIEFVSPSLFSTADNSTKDTDRQKNPIKIGPIYVSIPEIQRLDLATKTIQALLVPQKNIFPASPPVTIGKEITPVINDNLSCTPAPSWETYYSKAKPAQDTLSQELTLLKAKPLSEFDRGVTCDIQPLAGNADSKICEVGPDGQIRCGQRENAMPPTNPTNPTVRCDSQGRCIYDETVQVRTVFPHLYDIAAQTIDITTGILQTFRPEVVNSYRAGMGGPSSIIQATQDFREAFIPIPASISGVQYDLVNGTNIAIKDKAERDKTGWQLFFYRLGGLVNARNFILQLLQSKGAPSTAPTTGGTPPTTMPTTGGNPGQ